MRLTTPHKKLPFKAIVELAIIILNSLQLVILFSKLHLIDFRDDANCTAFDIHEVKVVWKS